jgi:glutamyl-tRNA reductase
LEKGGLFLIKVTYGDLGSLYFSSVKDFQIDEVYEYIKKNERIKESLVLWTCNRFEIYFYPGDKETVEFLEDYVAEKSLKHGVIHGFDAIRHLFLVSAGLDSMVVGENEILAQVKEAWQLSRKNGFSGSNLNAILKKAIEVGKKARREFGNGRHVKSVVSEALDQITFSKSQKVLVIGAGHLGRQVAGILSRRGIDFSISNRSRDKAKEISKALGAGIEKYDKKRWRNYDVIIAATKSPTLILNERDILNSKARIILDLGVPSNVTDKIPDGVRLVNMESLSEVIAARDERRGYYETESLKMVNDEFEKFASRLMNSEKDQLLKRIFDYSNKVIDEEMGYLEKRTHNREDGPLIRKGLESTRNKLIGFVINGIKNAKDIRSSETVTNMEMILNENLSRYEAKKIKKVR